MLTGERYYVLIETYWNVNYKKLLSYFFVEVCINRNILECKFISKFFKYSGYFGINRNILECKLIFLIDVSKHCRIVLIETYWNVNYPDSEYHHLII